MGDVLEAIAEGKPAELVGAARRLCDVIEGSEHDLDAALKWGALTYALAGDFHHWICSVGVTRKRAVLTFHFGSLLDDAGSRFVSGSSKFLRRLEYGTAEEVEANVVRGFLDQAVHKQPWFKEHWRELT